MLTQIIKSRSACLKPLMFIFGKVSLFLVVCNTLVLPMLLRSLLYRYYKGSGVISNQLFGLKEEKRNHREHRGRHREAQRGFL